MEKYTPGNLVGHGKTLQEVRHPIALRRGKVRLKRAQVAEVSPKSRALRERRVYRASVALHAWYSRLDLQCNMCLCEATQDRVSTSPGGLNSECPHSVYQVVNKRSCDEDIW
jgi:ABC-type uncharacterized transport system ATPase component